MNVYGDTSPQSLLNETEIREFRSQTVPDIVTVLRAKDVPQIA